MPRTPRAATRASVADAAASPITVVLVNGGPLAIRALKESPKVGAIVEAFLPGQFGAEAVMQLLLGDASPSGLLPVTVYDADFIDRRPVRPPRRQARRGGREGGTHTHTPPPPYDDHTMGRMWGGRWPCLQRRRARLRWTRSGERRRVGFGAGGVAGQCRHTPPL
eukprot:1718284-Prymnesium_polylepis.1